MDLSPLHVPASARDAASTPGVAPAELHPALWRAHQLGRLREAVWGSGFAELDAELPGGGWPAGVLTELLLAHAGVGEMRLLAPVLAAVQRQRRSVMLFAPPALPCGWAWQGLGLALQRLIVVHGEAAALPRRDLSRCTADTLWALEHALRSGHLGALLAWLPPRLPADALRRLQLAAQGHEGPVFLLREAAACARPSPAALRCALEPAGPDLLRLRLLKRRGPPQEVPLTLALPAVLPPSVRARAIREMRPAVAPAAEVAATRA